MAYDHKEYCRKWRAANPDKVRDHNIRYKAKHPTYHRDWQWRNVQGVTPEQVEQMRVAQDDACAGCRTPFLTKKMYVDHCHETQVFRGLLCNCCNVSLGRLKDSPETLRRLADYVEKSRK